MSKLRSVNTSFWSDPFIEDLNPSEKLLFLYLITNEKTNMLGIYEASLKKISFETGINKETVLKALKGFERIGKLKYINNYIILVNYMKHQKYNTNMKKSAIKAFNELPKELNNNNLVLDVDNPSKAFESLLNHLGMVSKVEDEIEEEIEDKKENKKIPPSFEQVKEYCLERNNNINPQNFIDFYTSKNWMIGRNKMKDWKAAVRTWENRDKKTQINNLDISILNS